MAVGEVGLILSLEASRLSRTDQDWCRLLELCSLFDTLIADADTVYDVSTLDDQLVLGIKATMSVAELKVLHQRMQQGTEAKARRGELVRLLPPGYVRDARYPPDLSLVPPPRPGTARQQASRRHHPARVAHAVEAVYWFHAA